MVDSAAKGVQVKQCSLKARNMIPKTYTSSVYFKS